MSPKDIRKFDPFVPFGFAAAVQAVKDSGIEVTEENSPRIGVAIGAGIGGLSTIEENTAKWLEAKSPRKISPFFIPGSIINAAAGQVSIHYGMRGPNLALVTACTTSTHSIGIGARCIQYGDADVMIAGGAEMAFTPLGLGCFGQARALSLRNDEPERASRPWDRDRDGFVMSEGAGAIVLEEYEHANARGAQIYAELVGFGMSGDAHHITAPPEDGEGARLAMSNAIRDAGIPCRRRLHQCACDLDRTRRPGGDHCDQARARRAREEGCCQLDEVHDRAPARRRGRGRGDLLDSRDPRRHPAADHQSRESRRGLRSRLRTGSCTQGARARSRCRTRSASAARTAASCSVLRTEPAAPGSCPVEFATSRHRAPEGFELHDDALLELHERYPDRYPVLLESIGGAQAIGRHDLLLALPGEQLRLSGDMRLEGTRRSDGSCFLAALDAWWRRRAVHRHCDRIAVCWRLVSLPRLRARRTGRAEPASAAIDAPRGACLAHARRDCPRPSARPRVGRRRDPKQARRSSRP